MVDITAVVTLAEYIAKTRKWLDSNTKRRLRRWFKQHTCHEIARILHQDVIHNIRALSPALKVHDWENAILFGFAVCNACRDIMGKLTELPEDELHCCLKVFTPETCTFQDDSVVTLARSTPYHSRTIGHLDDEHRVRKNTVWSALLGKNDGKTSWPNSYNCFCCNDLTKHHSLFQCTRDDWENHYKSTIVFPINYMTDPGTRTCDVSGFLAFDSPKVNAFPDLPDIFNFREDIHQYHTPLRKSVIFQMGAALADTLGIAFVPFCDYNSS